MVALVLVRLLARPARLWFGIYCSYFYLPFAALMTKPQNHYTLRGRNFWGRLDRVMEPL